MAGEGKRPAKKTIMPILIQTGIVLGVNYRHKSEPILRVLTGGAILNDVTILEDTGWRPHQNEEVEFHLWEGVYGTEKGMEIIHIHTCGPLRDTQTFSSC